MQDVYKRQSLGQLVGTLTENVKVENHNLFCDFEKASMLHSIAIRNTSVNNIVVNKSERTISSTLEAFSYTHLDVYKRQKM